MKLSLEPLCPLSRTLKEILFGSLLGDTNLQTYSNGTSWRAKFIQSEQHKEYLFHLYYKFQSYVRTPPKCISDSSGNIHWSFNTIVVPELSEFAQQFYFNKKKVIPDNDFLSNYLTPLTISYWFMQAGILKSNCLAYYLCTDYYSLIELKRLAEVLWEKYQIQVHFYKKGNSYRIYISKPEYLKFRNMIEPYIHVSMNYKLPDNKFKY